MRFPTRSSRRHKALVREMQAFEARQRAKAAERFKAFQGQLDASTCYFTPSGGRVYTGPRTQAA